MTNKEISKLSNFQINKKIEVHLNRTGAHPRNYCGEHKWLMPLIFEHKIRFTPFPDETYQAAKYAPKICIEVTNANPARALAECLLGYLIKKESSSV